MSTSYGENSAPLSKVLRVKQAASTLGISERTVYRRLRSGKLDQLPVELPGTDDVVTGVSDVSMLDLISSQIEAYLNKMACQNDMTNDKLSVLCQDLASRDAQIQTLLENQKELTLTIQKLQAQIYELARLALTQPSRAEEQPQSVPVISQAPSVKKPGGIAALLRILGRRNKER